MYIYTFTFTYKVLAPKRDDGTHPGAEQRATEIESSCIFRDIQRKKDIDVYIYTFTFTYKVLAPKRDDGTHRGAEQCAPEIEVAPAPNTAGEAPMNGELTFTETKQQSPNTGARAS